eukprot:tig00000903_g5513.t1
MSRQPSGLTAGDLRHILINFFNKRGFQSVAAQLENEFPRVQGVEDMTRSLAMDAQELACQILSFNNMDNDPARYQQSYGEVREWIHQSLEIYKGELLAILYPIFAHCFLELIERGYIQEAHDFLAKCREEHEHGHGIELHALQAVNDRQHLEENEIAYNLRTEKASVRMCQYSYNLLLAFLHQSRLMLIVSILNQHVDIRTYPGFPSAIGEDEPGAASSFLEREHSSINKREIHWGTLAPEPRVDKDKEKEKEKDKKKDDKEGDKDGGAGAGPSGAAGPEGKEKEDKEKGKDEKEKGKEKAEGGGKRAKKEDPKAAAAHAAVAKNRIPLPPNWEELRREEFEEARRAAALSAKALPSVCFHTFLNAGNSLHGVEFSADSRLAAASLADSSLSLFCLDPQVSSTLELFAGAGAGEGRGAGAPGEAGAPVRLVGHAGPVYSASFSPDNRFLLSASEDATVRLWSLELGANLVAYRGHNYPVWSVDFSPVGYYFATGGYDRTGRIWSSDYPYPLRILAGHLSDVDVVKFHPNCNYVATGSTDRSVRLWDVQSGECVRIFTGHKGPVHALAFSPDGQYLASAGEDRDVFIWDLGGGRRVEHMPGHEKTVWSLDWSRDGRLLASGSADATVRLWDPLKGRQLSTERDTLLKTFRTKSTPVFATRFARRNVLLAAGPYQGNDRP